MSSPNTTSSSSGKPPKSSRTETRQSKSARDEQQPLASTGMNFGVGGPSSGHSRKRKLDTLQPESPASASPDEDSSGGDGTSCTSLSLTSSKIAGDPVTHRYVVHISDTGLLAQRARSATDFTADGRVMSPVGSADCRAGGLAGRRSSHQYRFDCELGDIWTDVAGADRISGLMTSLLDGVSNPRRSVRRAPTNPHSSSETTVIDGLELRGYSILNHLSRGKFNTLILSAHSSSHQKKVVIKVLPSRDVKCTMSRSDDGSNEWTVEMPSEVRIQETLNHDNVVTILSHHVIDNRYVIALELCENGSIKQLLHKTAGGLLTEPVCRRYFGQMHSALTYLHSRSVVHRDIRAENFLLDSYDHVKLADFCSALHYANGDPLFTTRQGYPGYWPPEVLERKPFNPRTADVWALGVTLYLMLTSQFPFGVDPEVEVIKSMHRGLEVGGKTGPAKSVRLSQAVIQLLNGLLHYVIEVRFTLNRVRCSEWMSGRQASAPVSCNSAGYSLTINNKPYIGNFYLVAKPQKFKDSPHEKLLKDTFDI